MDKHIPHKYEPKENYNNFNWDKIYRKKFVTVWYTVGMVW